MAKKSKKETQEVNNEATNQAFKRLGVILCEIAGDAIHTPTFAGDGKGDSLKSKSENLHAIVSKPGRNVTVIERKNETNNNTE